MHKTQEEVYYYLISLLRINRVFVFLFYYVSFLKPLGIFRRTFKLHEHEYVNH